MHCIVAAIVSLDTVAYIFHYCNYTQLNCKTQTYLLKKKIVATAVHILDYFTWISRVLQGIKVNSNSEQNLEILPKVVDLLLEQSTRI